MKTVLVSRIECGRLPHHTIRFIMSSIVRDGTSLADFGVIPSGPGDQDNDTLDARRTCSVIADHILASE